MGALAGPQHGPAAVSEVEQGFRREFVAILSVAATETGRNQKRVDSQIASREPA
jgi:hypothetical protein